jgi:hypothetical protein
MCLDREGTGGDRRMYREVIDHGHRGMSVRQKVRWIMGGMGLPGGAYRPKSRLEALMGP